eukprot:7988003-Karenia_brevis.AAC.1
MVDEGVMEAFGMKVPNEIVGQWRMDGRRQAIGQAEFWAILVSKFTWKARLSNRRVVFFIDNDSARYALIHSYS